MLLRDLLSLGLASLQQRKLRTGLTVLGVAIGTLLMLLTLAGGLGVAEAVRAHNRGSEWLRTIRVDIGSESDPSDIPPEDLAVEGEMSDERRERLRKALETKHPMMSWKQSEPLTAARFDEWEQLPHVESIRPEISLSVSLLMENDARQAQLGAGPAGNTKLEETIVAGGCFSSDVAAEMLVHEYLAYQWGFHDDDSLDDLIGRTVRVEYFAREDPIVNSIQWASRGRGDLSPREAEQVARTLRPTGRGSPVAGGLAGAGGDHHPVARSGGRPAAR